MVYEKKFPKCPYRSYGGNHCSHKGSPNICVFAKCLEKCEFYNEWVELRKLYNYNNKDDSGCVETPEETIRQ